MTLENVDKKRFQVEMRDTPDDEWKPKKDRATMAEVGQFNQYVGWEKARVRITDETNEETSDGDA